MITNISHDLRTPLTSAPGYVDLILHSNHSNEEKQNELKIVQDRLKRLEELINSFFSFSKLSSNYKSIKFEYINVIAVIEECIACYYEDYKKEKRKIVPINPLLKFEMISNTEMLSRIFDNLIGNALQHSIGNLVINIEKKEKLKITFTNILLDPTLDMSSIFDEFYTVDISRTKKNTGLGLAIAKQFTEQLHGEIKASKKNGYLKITILFL